MQINVSAASARHSPVCARARNLLAYLGKPGSRRGFNVTSNFPPSGIVILTSSIQLNMGKKLIFDEKYRVVGVEGDRLLLRGVRSGDMLTVINPEPDFPLTQEDYPLGKLIALTDPSCASPNQFN